MDVDDGYQLVRLNPQCRRVSWLRLDGFGERPFPSVSERARVDLSRADAELVSYPANRKVLALKGKLMAPGKVSDSLKAIEEWFTRNTLLKRPTLHLTEAELGRVIQDAKQKAAVASRS